MCPSPINVILWDTCVNLSHTFITYRSLRGLKPIMSHLKIERIWSCSKALMCKNTKKKTKDSHLVFLFFGEKLGVHNKIKTLNYSWHYFVLCVSPSSRGIGLIECIEIIIMGEDGHTSWNNCMMSAEKIYTICLPLWKSFTQRFGLESASPENSQERELWSEKRGEKNTWKRKDTMISNIYVACIVSLYIHLPKTCFCTYIWTYISSFVVPTAPRCNTQMSVLTMQCNLSWLYLIFLHLYFPNSRVNLIHRSRWLWRSAVGCCSYSCLMVVWCIYNMIIYVWSTISLSLQHGVEKGVEFFIFHAGAPIPYSMRWRAVLLIIITIIIMSKDLTRHTDHRNTLCSLDSTLLPFIHQVPPGSWAGRRTGPTLPVYVSNHENNTGQRFMKIKTFGGSPQALCLREV